MKIKRFFLPLIGLCLAALLCTPIYANGFAIPDHLADETYGHAAQVDWSAFSSAGGSCYYRVDQQANCIYITLKMGHSTISSTTTASAQLILKQGQAHWIIDVDSANQLDQTDNIARQGILDINQDARLLLYTVAVQLPQPGQYEASVCFLIDGKEVRLKAQLPIDTAPPVTEKQTTTKPAAKTTTKPTATKKEKTSFAKTTTKKGAVNPQKGAGSTVKGDAAPAEETLLTEQPNFFQAMSKPARSVFIAAVILGVLALIVVGMALGNQAAAHKKGAKEETTKDEK